MSLGSAETTLLNLTSAYATFVNGGNKIYPTMINRIQDRRGKTIYSPSFAECNGCDRFSENIPTKNFPKINYNYEQIMSEQTAYQITSILEGAVKRGTGKN